MLLLIGLSTLITIYIGGLNVYNGTVTAGNIAEFVIYVNMLTWPVSALGWCVSIIQQAEASQKRINDFLNTQAEITSEPGSFTEIIHPEIELKNVSFIYPDSGIKALNNINLHIPAGTKLAITGKTASGKTSIAELLLRMYDTTSGEIFIDQKEIKKYSLENLRKNIAYVPQDVFLFSDTIEANINLGTEGENIVNSVRATKLAALDKEMDELPLAYNSILGERGVSLSGGQKQRLSLARALAKSAPIVILDDCFSAVDSETEQFIIQQIIKELEGKTLILITQHLKLCRYMDSIIVLDQGVIRESGNYNSLLQQKGLFSQLHDIENSQEY
jgi:ATP-binding cassette, subfamily B, multidrug efflux pump